MISCGITKEVGYYWFKMYVILHKKFYYQNSQSDICLIIKTFLTMYIYMLSSIFIMDFGSVLKYFVRIALSLQAYN